MADTYKILGQSKPGAAANADAYTVGAGKSAVIGALMVANTGAATTFRIFARIAGAAAAVGNAIAYDVAIGANEVITFGGLTLAATDVLTVYSTSGTVTFTAFGDEVS